MGFHKIYLNDIPSIKKLYRADAKSFISWIEKADAVIGPLESVRFVDRLLKKKPAAN